MSSTMFDVRLFVVSSSRYFPNHRSRLFDPLSKTMLVVARHLSRRLPSSVACGVLAKACAASSVAHISTTSLSAGSSLVSAGHHTRPSLATSASLPSRTFSTTLKENYDHVLVERRFPENADVVGGGVGIVTLHRPKALNALSDALFEDLIHALRAFDADDNIGCIVITGSGKAFAAGEIIFLYSIMILHRFTVIPYFVIPNIRIIS